MSNLIIIGAGGFGLEVAAYAEDIINATDAALTIKGFLDDTKPVNTLHAGYPVLGSTDAMVQADCLYIIAVGLPEGRKALAEKLSVKGAQFTSLLHPSGYVAATAKIDAGTVLAPFGFVGAKAHIGSHCLLNIYASAGHESVVGDYSVLSPYATTHGSAQLGKGIFMGNHTCVTSKIHIGDNAKLAAGSIVYNDVPAGATAMGNPAAFRQSV